MYKHIRSTMSALLDFCSQRNVHIFTLAILAITGSFSLGIQSVGDVQPVTLIEAGSTVKAGDMDASNTITIEDAIVILEIVRGYKEATIEHLEADPNGDYDITIDDAIRILEHISLQ